MENALRNKQRWTLIGFLVLVVTQSGVLCGAAERRLLNNLMEYYQKLERPVANESEAVSLKFGLTLQQIMDVDEKSQQMMTNVWLNMC